MKQDYDCQYIESKLLAILSSDFTESEYGEVQDFLDAGEYGLALETLVDIVIEKGNRIPILSFELICKLSDEMLMGSESISKRLLGFIADR